MSATVPCPQCQRPNAPHRETCIYCGTELPSSSALGPSSAPRRETPKGLDKAFERAMRMGDMRQLREVLETVEKPEVKPPVGPSPVSAGETVAASLPPDDPEEITEPELEPPPPPPDPDGLYEDLLQEVRQAAGWEDDPRGALEALMRAQEALSAFSEVLAELDAPPELVLPPFRQAAALFVATPNSAERVLDVAEALEIDAATARQVAVVPYPRAALRSNDLGMLEQRASRFRARLALPARVLDQADLRAQPPARLLLSLAADGPWCSAVSPSWEPESSVLAKLRVREDRPLPLRLVVVGEVVKQRFREQRGRRKDDVRLASHGERRRGVIDLHHDTGVLRVVEGVTSLVGWEGLDPRSSALAFRGLPELLAERYPDIPHTGRCVCRPTRQPEARDDGRIEATGWPAWEEHSRACRCLFMG